MAGLIELHRAVLQLRGRTERAGLQDHARAERQRLPE